LQIQKYILFLQLDKSNFIHFIKHRIRMRTLKFFTVIGMLLISFLLSAQVPTAVKNAAKTAAQTAAQTAQQPVKPNIIKKLPEKQQAMYDQMATDLQLTEVQKAKVIELAMERAVTLSEKMKTATTDEQKAELKKASGVEYQKKLEDALGVELAEKQKAWQKEYTLKMKAAAAPAK
jgi:hypothetical protein